MGQKVEQTPWLVQALLKNGNEVGNHNFSHPCMTSATALPGAGTGAHPRRDLDLLGCPQSSRLFRPPYSAYDDRFKAYLGHTGRHSGLMEPRFRRLAGTGSPGHHQECPGPGPERFYHYLPMTVTNVDWWTAAPRWRP